ncbi:hypothetical protein FDP41_011525 [Naegleria fowleri]|uniref:DUF7897 domain-containing protein n=1 Tax=Naegleria fowleri TaxID=5763 RepID=A0A6A5CB39_NAEFO|nr:uncharacterized protein FDP41_011525 [Naegleria fowleri]KAF0982595.1 hypothetical protein FDP41_011525 [Naegleria fowleri]
MKHDGPLFQKLKDSFSSHEFSRIALLKEIVKVTDWYFENVIFDLDDLDGYARKDDLKFVDEDTKHFRERLLEILNQLLIKQKISENDTNRSQEEWKEILKQAVLHQNFEGIEEFSNEFYLILNLANERQNLIRHFISTLLRNSNNDDHHLGFNEMERVLILRACNISALYHSFYVEFTKAVRLSRAAKEIEKRGEEQIDSALKNSYTIIAWNEETNELYDVPYAKYFREELSPIVMEFSELIKDLQDLKNAESSFSYLDEYIKYITKYRDNLLEKDKTKLEDAYRELDELWMDIRHSIQYVHDIEYGYCDVLRCKVIPDFSCRFLDEEYVEVNNFIRQKVQHRLLEYYKSRDTEISRKGVHAVEQSMCGIYYFPFICGGSLNFRFSGQSIPNRTQVSQAKGCKIFFDPTSTETYNIQTKALLTKLFLKHEEVAKYVFPAHSIKFFIAAHELGHAVYNLDCVRTCISTSTKTILEEPRAQLTATFVIKLLYDHGDISQQEMESALIAFVAEDLSNLVMHDKAAYEPYVISANYCYGLYEKLGFMQIVNDRIMIDNSKAYQVLCVMTELFMKILQAEDYHQGGELENILQHMKETSVITTWILKKCK